MQNLDPFWMASNFDGKYLWNGQRYSKSDKYLIDSDSSHVWQKMSGERWSTGNEDLVMKLYPLKLTFLKIIFRPLRGAAQCNSIFTRTRK